MADNLPSATPELPGDNKSAANDANYKRKTNPEKKNSPRNPRSIKWFGLSKTKWREIAGIAVLIPWVWNEFLDTHNFAKLCLLAITIAVAQGATLTFFKSRWRGFILAIWLISLFPVAATVWINSQPEPKPHFSVVLQLGDSGSSTVVLTNDFLFKEHFEKTPDSPNGNFLFHAMADGCIVIPVQSGESNKVFHFILYNDSSVVVNDLDVEIGLSKNSDWLTDQEWHKSAVSLNARGKWRLEITNVQFWAMQSPWVLRPFDSWHLPPITNDFNPAYISATNKLVQLDIRSTDFETMIMANIAFVSAPSNFSKPFVAPLKKVADGQYRLSITPDELIKSQQ
jgi:hypothetical protein